MLEVTQSPEEDDGNQGTRGGGAAAWAFLAGADFFVDEREERRDDQAENQEREHDRLEDENDIPRIPLLGERPERANAVVVGEIEQDVAEASEASVKEQ